MAESTGGPPPAGGAGRTAAAVRRAAEKVQPIGDIADQFPQIPGPKPKTYLELSGVKQMTILLVVICGMSFVTLLLWWSNRPTLKDVQALLSAGGTSTTQPVAPRDVVDLAAKLQAAHSEQYVAMFQTVVLTVLVPLFTLIAGYVFGRAKSDDKR